MENLGGKLLEILTSRELCHAFFFALQFAALILYGNEKQFTITVLGLLLCCFVGLIIGSVIYYLFAHYWIFVPFFMHAFILFLSLLKGFIE